MNMSASVVLLPFVVAIASALPAYSSSVAVPTKMFAQQHQPRWQERSDFG